jgi:dTDP-4-dehydrorhamnose reductase
MVVEAAQGASPLLMRVLITGAGGQVGRELVEWCEHNDDEVVACGHTGFDVTDRDMVLGAVLAVRPDAVVHAAAWTAVDACESDPGRAMTVNALGSRHVAEACARTGSHLVYLSTDYVFDGTKPEPYDEWDVACPTSAYGRSKLAGEQEVVSIAGAAATMVRISWVCGRYGTNMVKTLLRLAAAGAEPKFVDDQIGNPTVVGDLVPTLRGFAVDRRPGLFHVTNQGALSWFELARLVFELAGHDPDRVTAISTAELDPPRPAPRPANSVLDNAVMRLSGLPLLRHHRDALEDLVATLVA